MRAVILALAMTLACCCPALATCSFGTIGGLSFTYDVLSGAAATSSASMSVTCDAASSTNVALSIDNGLHSTTSNPWRKLLNSSNNQTLQYNIFTTAGYASIWGDGTNGTVTQSQPQTASTFSLTMYGEIPGAQNVSAGNFSDTVTVTMTF